MSFIKKALGSGLGGILGGLLFAKKAKPKALPGPVTRDDAALEAQREAELARRRGGQADRITGASGEPAGGLGRLIRGS